MAFDTTFSVVVDVAYFKESEEAIRQVAENKLRKVPAWVSRWAAEHDLENETLREFLAFLMSKISLSDLSFPFVAGGDSVTVECLGVALSREDNTVNVSYEFAVAERRRQRLLIRDISSVGTWM